MRIQSSVKVHINKFTLIIILLLHYGNVFTQELIRVQAKILNTSSVGIPFASVSTKNKYGCIANEMGEFIINAGLDDSLYFSSVGYVHSSKSVSEITKNNNIIVLDSISYNLGELVVTNAPMVILNSRKKRIIRHGYRMTSNFWHGTVYLNKSLKNKQLLAVRFKAGFRGSPPLTLRLGVFSLDERGFPKENLLKKEVIIPTTNKYEWKSVDLENQELFLNQDKLCVALELINPSTGNLILNEKYSPLIGTIESRDQYPIFITNKLNKWVKLGKSCPYFELTIR
jgi:hypothetical protein